MKISIKRISLFIGYSIFPFFVSIAISFASPDFPEEFLAYPVLLKENNKTASGFYYQCGESLYLVTARHFLFDTTSVNLSKKIRIPQSMIHVLSQKEDQCNDGFKLTFIGVMAKDQRDHLMALAPKSNSNDYLKAIELLYLKSQELELTKSKIISLSYAPCYSSKQGRNIIEIDLKQLLNFLT